MSEQVGDSGAMSSREFDPEVIEAVAEAIHANRYAGQPRPPFTPATWGAQDEKIRERYRLQAVAALDAFRLRVPYQEEARSDGA